MKLFALALFLKSTSAATVALTAPTPCINTAMNTELYGFMTPGLT